MPHALSETIFYVALLIGLFAWPDGNHTQTHTCAHTIARTKRRARTHTRALRFEKDACLFGLSLRPVVCGLPRIPYLRGISRKVISVGNLLRQSAALHQG